MSAVAAAVSVAVAVWLTISPDAVGYGEPARSIHQVVGPSSASVAVIALWRVVRAVLRANVVAAVALTVGALVWPTSAAAVANGLACAVALGALALVPIGGADRFAGGWLSVIRRSER